MSERGKWPRASLEDRTLARIAMKGPDDCWPWLGGKNAQGYGLILPNGSDQRLRVHRVIYELFVGPIPDGLTIDHLCHNRDQVCAGGPSCEHRGCCNPAHLEAIERGENVRRGAARVETCKRGHPKTPQNHVVRANGKIECLFCRREVTMARYHRTKVLKGPMTTCRRDHPFTSDNTYIDKHGHHHCRVCRREGRQATSNLSI